MGICARVGRAVTACGRTGTDVHGVTRVTLMGDQVGITRVCDQGHRRGAIVNRDDEGPVLRRVNLSASQVRGEIAKILKCFRSNAPERQADAHGERRSAITKNTGI